MSANEFVGKVEVHDEPRMVLLPEPCCQRVVEQEIKSLADELDLHLGICAQSNEAED